VRQLCVIPYVDLRAHVYLLCSILHFCTMADNNSHIFEGYMYVANELLSHISDEIHE